MGRDLFSFHRAAPGLFLCLAGLGACVAGPGQPDVRVAGGVTSARVTSVSREYRPPSGGQTIQPPQRMADVATLWMPLTREERARIISPSASLPPAVRAVSTVRAAAWLPPSESGVMREYLYRLSTTQAHVTRRALDRAATWLPMIQEIFAGYGLPPELVGLPLVESAFEPGAVSPAGAAGLWQLMPATARRFGLTVKAGRDERFDPRKSTEAAARYLNWLHGYFHDWPLALAAYNCGEGAMDKFLRRLGAATLPELAARGEGTVPSETLRFVPQFVAAATVLSQSGNLGLYAVNLLEEEKQGGESSLLPRPAGRPAAEENTLCAREAPARPLAADSAVYGHAGSERTAYGNAGGVGSEGMVPAMRRVTP